MDSTKSSLQGKSELSAPLSNETKVVESVEQAAENMWQRGSYKNDERGETIYIIGAKFGAQWQASQFKNTDAVKVITDRIERRIEHLKIVGGTAYLNLRPTNVRIDELNHILKLIQP